MSAKSNEPRITTYDEIMGISDIQANAGGNSNTAERMAIQSLSTRLHAFRTWLTDEAQATIHPSICLVNGEATDGTKNAPVLILEKSANSAPGNNGNNNNSSSSHVVKTGMIGNVKSLIDGSNGNGNNMTTSVHNTSNTKKVTSSIFEGRVGMIDHDITAVLYDRTMGCQVRTVREMKPNDTLMILPKTSMITPDLVASSDAGKALLACCCRHPNTARVWDQLENTSVCETKQLNKIIRNSGTQTLVKILQERKRAESAYKQRLELIQQQQQQDQSSRSETSEAMTPITYAEYGTISTRAPYILFLIHQRFSNAVHVPVSSPHYVDTMDSTSNNDNANENADEHSIQVPLGSPSTFAPYARTLPSSVSVPLCWKRNELAMLSGCIPGLSLLLDVGASTIHLASEFIALLNAGILERFPHTFPPGLITWDRYVWAASVFSSRNLPATSYYNMGDTDGSTFRPNRPREFQSPPEIWDELGVLIPLLDMFNHEVDDHQITWEQTRLSMNNDYNGVSVANGINEHDGKDHPRVIMHKKVKKGSEIYSCYGPSLSNTILILQYGFAQINNISDEVRMGWAISDAVGNVNPPFDCVLPYQPLQGLVYESNDEHTINEWWTPARLSLLQEEACCSDSTLLSNLKLKKKLTVNAYANGQFDPILLAAIIVATMPEKTVEEHIPSQSDSHQPKQTILLSKNHQHIIRCYLQFTFTRKLEKLLQNLNNGLSDFFSNLKLWTKSADGGLHYQQNVDDNGNSDCVGWQTFFDAHAYKAAMEVESRYYAMGTESCVLTLYDGQLRALQASLDVVTDSVKFESIVLKQLEDLGYEISHDDDDHEILDGVDEQPDDDMMRATNDETNGEATSDVGKKSPKNRKRNRRRNNKKNNNNNTSERASALKLHIGNLSYTTKPADLYDYFTSIYGHDNVLECHIPIERETGKTRGFGFVAMPEEVAESVLASGRKFTVDGRVLKVARSSSAGAVSTTKVVDGPPPINSERCRTCGYRPKYCVCPEPNVGGAQRMSLPSVRVSSSSSRNDPLIDRHFGPNDYYRDDDYRHRDYRDESSRNDYDRGRSYRYHHGGNDHRHGSDRDTEYSRERRRRDVSPHHYHDRDRSPHGSRSRSSSHRREQDEWDRSSRRHDKEDESDNDGRGRKRSRSDDRGSRRRKEKKRHRSRSSGSSRSPL